MELKNKQNSLIVMIHILVWIIVFCIPLFTLRDAESPFNWSRYLRFSMVPLFFMLVFYLNYFVLVEKLLFRKQVWTYVLINIGLIVVCTLLMHYWQELDMHKEIPAAGGEALGGRGGYDPPRLRPEQRPRPKHMFYLRDGMMLTMTVGIALAIRMTMQWFKTEREKQALETAHAEAELKNLKNQLNPHFLFNTLNNIYALIDCNPEKARYGVESLSRMLRHVLYDTNLNRVSLEEEMSFVRSYVELMALRLPPSTRLEVDLPTQGNGIRIAPLLFISLIENAFKHGISHKKESFIRVVISLEGRSQVVCVVENTYVPRYHDRPDSGIGIVNLQKRLQLLYPGRHTFVTEVDGQVYKSILTIDI